jgi:penicillin G amidase
MKWIKPAVLTLLISGLFVLLNFRHGDVPPLGKLLNPFAGFWTNGSSLDEMPASLDFPGLEGIVKIVWDDRRVPHIFADNLHDLMFAQGYCIARDRLWQLDFQSRSATGRLSEVIGPRALMLDRFARQIGMGVICERTTRSIQADSLMSEAALAYCDGVNAWIDGLDDARLPIEFKILDYRPEAWTIEKIASGYATFCLSLSFGGNDSNMTFARTVLGDSAFSLLFPDNLPFVDPIIPKGTKWEFTPLQIPKPPTRPPPRLLTPLAQAQGRDPQFVEDEILRGSNNWAVSGSRTASGHPILCNDPHLGLSLPAIWYEIQLASPEMNVYGVSGPGAPGVLIGFNKQIAFGETNAQTDVMDWYKITFRDESCGEYLYAGTWRPAARRVEIIKVRGAADIIDTVIYTHHGPVVTRPGQPLRDGRIPTGCAMRWTALDSSRSLAAFLRIDMAQSYAEYVDALKQYAGPAQNFAYADVHGDIAIWHNGKFPLRWKDQGKFLCDGTDPAYDWQGWIPHDHLPHVFNPSRGFVSSANQPPADSSYPYQLIGGYIGFERSTRIDDQLRNMQRITAADMMVLQNDVLNLRAVRLLPHLLPLIVEDSMSDNEKRCNYELKNWRYDQNPDLIAPTIFDYWWRSLFTTLWSGRMTSNGRSLPFPRADVTMDLLLSGKAGAYLDDPSTPRVEGFAELARASFSRAVRQMEEELGTFGAQWSLGVSRGTNILHIAQIPGLGRMSLKTGGASTTINAIQKRGGPSWRMIVEMDSIPKAWGVFPGGQSGNPGSPFYDYSIDTWVGGKYHELVFLQTPEETNERVQGITTLRRKH